MGALFSRWPGIHYFGDKRRMQRFTLLPRYYHGKKASFVLEKEKTRRYR